MKFTNALSEPHDSFVTISLALTDLMTDAESPARARSAYCNWTLLYHIREAHMSNFD
jgi:hypothetical protein